MVENGANIFSQFLYQKIIKLNYLMEIFMFSKMMKNF